MRKFLIGLGIFVVLLLIVMGYFYAQFKPTPTQDIVWGVTFSQIYSEELGLDWKTTYLDMLNDLKPKKLRLMAYWERIEPEQNKYDFHEVAEMLDEAQKRNVEVILVVGLKQPRWPECHQPEWAKKLSAQDKTQAQLEMVKNAVNYYKQFSAIKTWQVENEALFSFGDNCPTTPKDIIKQEMEIVRQADNRPILLSDSGELGTWIPIMNLKPDIFASTMYRVVHSPRFGYFKYPLPPEFFKLKAGIASKLTGQKNIIGVELQAEPWFANGVHNTDLQTQNALMNPKIFTEYVKYADDVGFPENYLWGVEWWYWMAQKHGDWGMWNEAKTVLSR